MAKNGPVPKSGILEINAMQLRQVVVEDVGPDQTRQGPGHAPGTAGVGQPGDLDHLGGQLLM